MKCNGNCQILNGAVVAGFPGDRAASIDCCSGCEAGMRPPADISECLETVCS